jgi:hypothetical protein
MAAVDGATCSTGQTQEDAGSLCFVYGARLQFPKVIMEWYYEVHYLLHATATVHREHRFLLCPLTALCPSQFRYGL